MASVHIDFVPPDRPGFTKLHIYEAPTEGTVPGDIIETVEEIGAYPNYITRYSTNLATSVDKWFSIQWEDDKGVKTDVSGAVQGNSRPIVAEIIDRALQRDPGLNEIVVKQEAEGVIEKYLGIDPYSTTAVLTYSQLNGLTYLVMARAMIERALRSSSVASFTAGLVSMKSGESTSVQKAIDHLIELANEELGLNTTVILQMEEVKIGNSISAWGVDQSRLMMEIELQ